MSMTRKHFKLLAEALKDSMPEPTDETAMSQWQKSCKHVAGVLRQANPAFNRDKFLEACGVES